MKKTARIALVFILALLYCFAAGVSNGTASFSIPAGKASTEQESFFSKTTAKFSDHTTASQFKLSENIGKKDFTPYCNTVFNKNASLYIPDTFLHYKSLTRDFTIRFGPHDIIYPFHSFW